MLLQKKLLASIVDIVFWLVIAFGVFSFMGSTGLLLKSLWFFVVFAGAFGQAWFEIAYGNSRWAKYRKEGSTTLPGLSKGESLLVQGCVLLFAFGATKILLSDWCFQLLLVSVISGISGSTLAEHVSTKMKSRT